jgi:hypothetical protein
LYCSFVPVFFVTVPTEGKRSFIIFCFDVERRDGDEFMNGIKAIKKQGEGRRNEINESRLYI